MKITLRTAMTDLREVFLSNIFKGYPDHKKLWKAEDINKEFTNAMYEITMDYLDIIDGRKE